VLLIKLLAKNFGVSAFGEFFPRMLRFLLSRNFENSGLRRDLAFVIFLGFSCDWGVRASSLTDLLSMWEVFSSLIVLFWLTTRKITSGPLKNQ
jgi:hypothetical protein